MVYRRRYNTGAAVGVRRLIEDGALARKRWWALRLVAEFGLADAIMARPDNCKNLCPLLGIEPSTAALDAGTSPFDRKQAKARHAQAVRLRSDAEAASKADHPPVADAPFFRNTAAVAEVLGLDEVEREVLEVALMLNRDSALAELDELFEDITREDCMAILATACGRPLPEVERALRPTGVLAQSGLLRFDHAIKGRSRLFAFLDVMMGLNTSLHAATFSVEELLEDFAPAVRSASLAVEDYPHLKEFSDLARRVLGAALEHRTRGVNLLIYGAPGTGKTEYAKALARSLAADLREVPTGDEGGDTVPGTQRARAFQFAQAALAGRPGQLLMFDEIEDLFPELSFGMFTSKEKVVSKGWVNRVLEVNPVPTLWLSNEIEQMDPAYRRRFDLAIEFRVPPRGVRKRIASRYLSGLGLDDRFLDRIADADQVSPALVQQAAQVAELAMGVDKSQDVTRALNGALDALGLPVFLPAEEPVADYRLEYLNPSADLGAIMTGLARAGEGRLCLYGAPGTGKTAFARHVAERLNRSLIAKRGSDLLSMWVGGTEKNIATMFRAASEEGAVLLLDEADSLLRSRDDARHSWEVTQVNEMLTQMERFRGVFICSTNRRDDLDPACLRRFDRKIEFRALDLEQRWALLQAFLAKHGVAVPAGEAAAYARQQLAGLTSLTPGDFAAVARGRRLEGGVASVDVVLCDLAAECAVKRGERRAIGFVN